METKAKGQNKAGRPESCFYFGASDANKGAQAMLFTAVSEMRKRFPGIEVYCCKECHFASDYSFRVLQNRHLFYNELGMCGGGWRNRLRSLRTRLKALLRPHGSYRNAMDFANAFRKGNGVVIDVGGYQFGSDWSVEKNRECLAIIEACKRYNQPCFYMPQSFGPFDFKGQDTDLLKDFARVMAYPVILYAREEAGAKQLQAVCPRARIACSADLVLESRGVEPADIFVEGKRELHYRHIPVEGRHNVGIAPNMRTFEHGDKHAILAAYAGVIRYLLMTDATIYLFRHSREDLEACRWLKEMMGEEAGERLVLVEDEMNSLEFDAFVQQFDYLLASRFHSIVHAFRNTVPCIALGWAVKYQELLASHGQEAYVFNIAKDADGEGMVSAVQRMEANWRQEKETIAKHLKKLKGHNCFDAISAYFGEPTGYPHLEVDALQQAVPDCTGCAACMNSCPAGAISMPMGADGFYKPVIDPAACINCGKCMNTCPVKNDSRLMELQAPAPEKIPVEFYYGYSNDRELRRNSSSGGAFSELARQVFSQGGAVFGMVLEGLHPTLRMAENMEELTAMRGSKYLQGYIGHTLRQVKEELETGRLVLYTGTPCQIGGLKAYLKREYGNLITVDIICHGVPSYNLMEAYLETWQPKRPEGAQNVVDVFFRDKGKGEWMKHGKVMRLTWNNGAVTYSATQRDLYTRAFLSDLFLNEGCHNCRYTGLDRKLPDITMGDAWGIWLHKPEVDSADGVSLLLAHTRKGKDLLDKLKEGGHMEIQPCNGEIALKYNPSVLRPWKAPENKAEALAHFGKMPLQKLLNTYAPLTYKPSLFRKLRNFLGRIKHRIFR